MLWYGKCFKKFEKVSEEDVANRVKQKYWIRGADKNVLREGEGKEKYILKYSFDI